MYLRSFPDNETSQSLRFLTEKERLGILARVNCDRGDAQSEEVGFVRPRLEGSGTPVERHRDLLLVTLQIWASATVFGTTTTVPYALAYCKRPEHNSAR